MRKIIGILLLIGFLGTICEASLLKEKQTLTVSGTGLTQVEPDTAIVQLGIEVIKKTAQDAQTSNAEVMHKVITAIEKQGISKDKIQTSGFNLWPEFKYETNQPAKIVGYHCRNQINVTIENMTNISKIIDAGLAAGANNLQGIQFLRRNDTEAKKLAFQKAVKDAQAKASAIAEAAGLKIKEISSIIEGEPSSTRLATIRAAGVETPISPGLIEIREDITVTYKLSEK